MPEPTRITAEDEPVLGLVEMELKRALDRTAVPAVQTVLGEARCLTLRAGPHKRDRFLGNAFDGTRPQMLDAKDRWRKVEVAGGPTSRGKRGPTSIDAFEAQRRSGGDPIIGLQGQLGWAHTKWICPR